MPDKIHGSAQVRFDVTFTGDRDELVRLAESLNGEALDSFDLGDTMGVFIRLLAEHGELNEVGDAGGLLFGEMESELFQWEGPIADYTEHKDCPGFDRQEFHWHCHTHDVFNQPW